MRFRRNSRRFSCGLSLVELLIATGIGLFILAAIGSVYIGSKNTYQTAESIARLQDEARVAVTLIRNSLQHAGYFGRLDSAIVINGRKNSGSDLPDFSADCAPGWSIDLDRPVESPNTAPGNPYSGSCLHGSLTRGLLENTDLLVVRRTDSAIANLTNTDNIGKIVLRADVQRGELFINDGTAGPEGYSDPPLGEDRLLVTEMYYISPNSYALDDGVPMLRRLFLSELSGSLGLRTEQIAQNVEQLQVQYGEDIDDDGDADLFVDPPNAVTGRAVSVRFWLLVRSATREAGFSDTNTYEMGDTSYTPPAAVRDFRRALITQTVDLRNL